MHERRRYWCDKDIIWEDELGKTVFQNEEDARKLAESYYQTHELLEPETIMENANEQKWFTFDNHNNTKDIFGYAISDDKAYVYGDGYNHAFNVDGNAEKIVKAIDKHFNLNTHNNLEETEYEAVKDKLKLETLYPCTEQSDWDWATHRYSYTEGHSYGF